MTINRDDCTRIAAYTNCEGFPVYIDSDGNLYAEGEVIDFDNVVWVMDTYCELTADQLYEMVSETVNTLITTGLYAEVLGNA